MSTDRPPSKRYQAFLSANIEAIPQVRRMPEKRRLAFRAVASVLPFKVNNYVVDELIDWRNGDTDPMFQLAFPQEGMLAARDFARIYSLHKAGAPPAEIEAAANAIRMKLNPHPAGQMDLNVPVFEGEPQAGMQHKYRETVLFFPSQGQTCHAYCTYCFRWAQFVGLKDLRFSNSEVDSLVRYLRRHSEVSDVLITGGDPMVMKSQILKRYIDPLLDVPSLESIRIGTKSLAWWPYRFLSDPDADDMLRLLERVSRKGKNLALMAHYSHPRELETRAGEAAVRRLRETGLTIRCQAPLIRRVNDSAEIWSDMWRRQVGLGMVPYYMFVERDTGPKHYFEVPLARALRIFEQAFQKVSGLGRTVRGPSMSCMPGKVLVDGVADVGGKRVFVLKFIQARDPAWANRVFFADFDEKAAWLTELRPAFEKRFFFEKPLEAMRRARSRSGVRIERMGPAWPAPGRELIDF